MEQKTKYLILTILGIFILGGFLFKLLKTESNFTQNPTSKIENHKSKMNWLHLTDTSQLASITKESFQHPVLIYKHSTTCSISATAKNRLERNWNQAEVGSLKPYFLDLLRYRSISNQVAETFGIEHESPQVLIIENGKCVYHESHLGISFNDIARLQSY